MPDKSRALNDLEHRAPKCERFCAEAMLLLLNIEHLFRFEVISPESGMRKSGNRFSARIPLYTFEIDHDDWRKGTATQFHSAAAARGFSSLNCAASVDSRSAMVDALPPETASATASK